MDAYAAWLKICDWVTAMVTEGMMHDDFPEYDWYESFQWGDNPVRAVSGAVTRRRCNYCGGWSSANWTSSSVAVGICTC